MIRIVGLVVFVLLILKNNYCQKILCHLVLTYRYQPPKYTKCFFFIKIHASFTEKWTKMLKIVRSYDTKLVRKHNWIYPDMHKKLLEVYFWLWPILRPGFVEIHSVVFVHPADKPTNQQTNGHGWKHNLHGGGNNHQLQPRTTSTLFIRPHHIEVIAFCSEDRLWPFSYIMYGFIPAFVRNCHRVAQQWKTVLQSLCLFLS